MISELALRALRALSAVPHHWLVSLGNVLGDILYWLAAPRRRIARTNLRLCFPDLAEAERTRISRAHFRYFARSFFDRFVLWYQPAERIRDLVQVRGIEHPYLNVGRIGDHAADRGLPRDHRRHQAPAARPRAHAAARQRAID